MPDLLASLQKHDLGHLRIVAGLWGLELDSNEADPAAEELAASLLDPQLVAEVLDSLSAESRAALTAMTANAGRLPWAEFSRRFGDIRDMGPGRRDREKPHLKPASPAESLFYRALLARAFFDTDKGPLEFAYIPEDLLPLILDTLQAAPIAAAEPLGRPASPGERGIEIPASDRILDDATSLLAALRMGRKDEPSDVQSQRLRELLSAAGLVKGNAPQAESVRKFLEAPRAEAFKKLTDAWLTSDSFNELRQVPSLACEGEWSNPPQETREFLMNLIEAAPAGKWWSLSAFVRAVKEKYPDFQRPAGDYDSWFIKRKADGAYLRGFSHWDEVDGALIRYFIDVLHWLGLADLAGTESGGPVTAFRLATLGERKEEKGKIGISSNGRLLVPRTFSRAARYQIARFCEWEDEKPDEYPYRITASSLTRAGEQGLKVEHLLSLLVKYSEAGVPPQLVKTLKRWEANGTEARMQSQVVLRVSRPELLEELRKTRAVRFLGESLGPTTVVVKSGAQSKVLAALTELGLLAEDETTNMSL
ncbi:MAG: helicase-associated domain-containing protein [Chloroflexi bacterium]|nr:helicase-associated domain-containing protein [Chloroflexota bacterium]